MEEKRELIRRMAFVDLDGTVADNTRRAGMAGQVAASYVQKLPRRADERVRQQVHASAFHSDEGLYNPRWVPFDTLIPGAVEGIMALDDRGYTVFLLTSRPESLRTATEEWCRVHGIDVPSFRLLMRPLIVADHFIRTTAWKTVVVLHIAQVYQAKEVIVIDDDQRTIDELRKYGAALGCPLMTYTSIQDAMQAEEHA